MCYVVLPLWVCNLYHLVDTLSVVLNVGLLHDCLHLALAFKGRGKLHLLHLLCVMQLAVFFFDCLESLSFLLHFFQLLSHPSPICRLLLGLLHRSADTQLLAPVLAKGVGDVVKHTLVRGKR